MELRYCEECGEVIKIDSGNPISLSDQYVCERCQNGGPGRKENPSAAEEHFGNVLEGGALDLFSQQTIALRRQQVESESKKSQSSRLRLVKSGSSVVATSALPQAGEEGSATPSRSAQRIMFRCIHCRAPLAIRPVDRTSKLVCPQCRREIFVTASGRFLKPTASVVVRQNAGGGIATAGSVVLRKPGSSVHLKPSAPGATGSPVATGVVSGIGRQGSSRVVTAPPPGRTASNRNLKAASRQGSVRLSKVNPRASQSQLLAEEERRKPTSAFEEHKDREDPSKTAFITEEPTTDLSRIASHDAMKSLQGDFAPQSAPRRAPHPLPAEDLPAENELLQEGDDYASVAARSFDSAPLEKSTRTVAPRPRQPGLVTRVLRALFTP